MIKKKLRKKFVWITQQRWEQPPLLPAVSDTMFHRPGGELLHSGTDRTIDLKHSSLNPSSLHSSSRTLCGPLWVVHSSHWLANTAPILDARRRMCRREFASGVVLVSGAKEQFHSLESKKSLFCFLNCDGETCRSLRLTVSRTHAAIT